MNVEGQILDAKTGTPLPGSVHVYAMDASGDMTGTGTVAEPDGTFTLTLKPGDEYLAFSHVGYGVTVFRIQDLGETIKLSEQAQMLDEATVTANANTGGSASKSFFKKNWGYIAAFALAVIAGVKRSEVEKAAKEL